MEPRNAFVGALRPVLALTLGAAIGACFDSDEKFKVAATTGVSTTTVGAETTSTTTGQDDSTTGDPDQTCRDAIQCIAACAFEIAMSELPEPDLSCILDCTEALTVPEALDLLNLANCASDQCKELGACEDTTGTSSGSSSSSSSSSSGSGSSSGSSSSSSTSGGVAAGADGALLGECLTCIFGYMQDPMPIGCEAFGGACE